MEIYRSIALATLGQPSSVFFAGEETLEEKELMSGLNALLRLVGVDGSNSSVLCGKITAHLVVLALFLKEERQELLEWIVKSLKDFAAKVEGDGAMGKYWRDFMVYEGLRCVGFAEAGAEGLNIVAVKRADCSRLGWVAAIGCAAIMCKAGGMKEEGALLEEVVGKARKWRNTGEKKWDKAWSILGQEIELDDPPCRHSSVRVLLCEG